MIDFFIMDLKIDKNYGYFIFLFFHFRVLNSVIANKKN